MQKNAETTRSAFLHFCILAFLQCVVGACASERSRGALTAEEIASENRAIGLMGQYDFDRAREAFAHLAAAHPDRPGLQLNLALATLNRQRDGDDESARGIFESVLRNRADDVRAHFGLGLVLLHN